MSPSSKYEACEPGSMKVDTTAEKHAVKSAAKVYRGYRAFIATNEQAEHKHVQAHMCSQWCVWKVQTNNQANEIVGDTGLRSASIQRDAERVLVQALPATVPCQARQCSP
jgi:hypothetical protein